MMTRTYRTYLYQKLNLIQSSLCEKYDGIVGNQASYASNLFESMTSNRIDGRNQTGWILTENVSPEWKALESGLDT